MNELLWVIGLSSLRHITYSKPFRAGMAAMYFREREDCHESVFQCQVIESSAQDF